MPLTKDAVEKALDKYKFPTIGRGKCSPGDEWVEDALGRRELLMWAEVLRWDVGDKGKPGDLLDRAVERMRAGLQEQADRAGCPLEELQTSEIQHTTVRTDDSGARAELNLWIRCEHVGGRK